MLEEEGHEVVGEAGNGAEAIVLARDLRPDVVFMDVKMPGVDGIEGARTIGDERLAPVVMVTAFSQAGHVEQASAAGAMAYIVKPFSRTDILPAMRIDVSRFAAARALESRPDRAGRLPQTPETGHGPKDDPQASSRRRPARGGSRRVGPGRAGVLPPARLRSLRACWPESVAHVPAPLPRFGSVSKPFTSSARPC